jgi:hypothetical protein
MTGLTTCKVCVLLLALGCLPAPDGNIPALSLASTATSDVRLVVQSAPTAPVIDADHPDLADNRYGFEGGSVVKVAGIYHLFVAEMSGDPFWVKMRLAHWTSANAIAWRRASTLFETSGKSEPGDRRFSIWAPMPIFDDSDDLWDLFYVAYRPRVREAHEGPFMDGRIVRAVSEVKGRGGIGGPYRDIDVVLKPDANSQPWEGQQGTDSFYPWRVRDRWYAFYGSHQYEPLGSWLVGLAEAPALAGPWTRRAGNPSPIERKFIENPIVAKVGSHFVVIYDSSAGADETPNYVADGRRVGYSVSEDGIHWARGRKLDVLPKSVPTWSSDVRTPLCLIDEGGGEYLMLYTGKRKDREFWAVGLARLRVATHRELN